AALDNERADFFPGLHDAGELSRDAASLSRCIRCRVEDRPALVCTRKSLSRPVVFHSADTPRGRRDIDSAATLLPSRTRSSLASAPKRERGVSDERARLF